MGSASIFIVDDDDAVRHSMQILLESAGHSVRSFSTGAAFLDYTMENAAHLLLLDYHLPDRNGLDILQAIRSAETKNSQTPAVIISGQITDDLVRRAQDLSVHSVLPKPLDVQSILKIAAAASP